MKASHPEVVAAHRANPGETLRKARENKGLALGDVAVQLNLTAHALRNLEAGAFEQLPGHTFARGYVRAYAKLMGMDQNRLVAEFDQYTGTDASGSSVASLTRIEEPARVSQSLVKLFSVVALLALGGVGFFWWQGENQRLSAGADNASLEHVEVEGADGTTEIHPLDEPEDQAVSEGQQPEGQVLPLEPNATEQVPVAETQAPVAAVAPAAPATSTVPAPAAVAPVAPVAAPTAAAVVTPAAPVAAAPAAPVASTAPVAAPAPVEAAPAPVGSAKVHIQFTADCWTQVTDGNGKVLFSAIKRKGDSLELTGKPPFAVRLGFARGAQVSYNGQAVDVAPFTSGETARLKLGQ